MSECYWCKHSLDVEKDESKYCPWHRYTMISNVKARSVSGEEFTIHRMAHMFDSVERLARQCFEAGYAMALEEAKLMQQGLLDLAKECEASTGETASAEEALVSAIEKTDLLLKGVPRQT